MEAINYSLTWIPARVRFLLPIAIGMFFFSSTVIFSQNISINTSGNANSTNSMLEVLQASTADLNSGIFSRRSGVLGAANRTAYAFWSEVICTGATSTNVAGYFTASGATNNYAIIVPGTGGSVGIGTITPGAKLEVRQDNASVVLPLRLKNDDGTPANLVGVGVSFERDRPWAAVIGQQTISGSYDQGKLFFQTRTSDILGLETKMTILANGNVGIGIASPTAKLHVDAGDIGVSRIDGGDVSPYARFGLSNGYEQYLANNAFFNAVANQWNYVVTAGYGGLASTMNQTSGTINFETTSGGVNPITWASRLHIANNGAISVNGVGNYGTSGFVLTSQGNAPPQWLAPAGGGGGACAATTVTSELTGNGGSPCVSPCTGGTMTLRQCASTCNGLNYSGFTDWYTAPMEVLASLGSVAPDNGNTTQIWTVTPYQATAGTYEALKLSDYSFTNVTATNGFTNGCRCVR